MTNATAIVSDWDYNPDILQLWTRRTLDGKFLKGKYIIWRLLVANRNKK